MSLSSRISYQLRKFYSKCLMICTIVLAAILILVAFLIFDSPICEHQLATWHTVFLGYIGLSAVISALIVIMMEYSKSSRGDYMRESVILSYAQRTRNLVVVPIITFAFIVILLSVNACVSLPIVAVILSVFIMIPTIFIIIKYTIDIYSVKYDSNKFIEKARNRFVNLLCNSESADYEYSKEIKFLSSRIENSIVNRNYTIATNAIHWFQNEVLALIPITLKIPDVLKLSTSLAEARDGLARIVIEASASGNRGLLNTVLIQTELSSQHFVKAGLSTSFHSLLDAYQLAMNEQNDSAIIEQYASCFSPFGNLRAAISVLEDKSDKLQFKFAILSTTLVLIFYSLRSPECSGSCARLINMLPDLDTAFLKEEESAEDYTGLGCWLLVFRLMKRISESNRNTEIHKSAQLHFEAMLAKTFAPEFPWDHLDEASACIQTYKGQVLESSTVSSFYFCITRYLPGYHGRIDSYVIRAIEYLREHRQRSSE